MRTWSLLLIMGLSLSLGACKDDKPQAESTPAAAVPEKAEQVPVEQAKRLVTLTPAVTETVFALGLGEQVVAADASSTYPAEAEKVATLPYFRQLAVEPLLALKPDQIVTGPGAGPPPALDQLKATGVEFLTFDDATSLESAKDRVAKIAASLGADPKPLLAKMDADIEKAKAAPEVEAKVLHIYARGQKIIMAGGPDTAAGDLIELTGAEVVPKDFEGFKPLTAEAVIAAEPDVIVMGESGVQSVGGVDSVFEIPGVAQTPAGKAKRLVLVNDQLMVFGPRSGQAVFELKTKIAEALGK